MQKFFKIFFFIQTPIKSNIKFHRDPYRKFSHNMCALPKRNIFDLLMRRNTSHTEICCFYFLFCFAFNSFAYFSSCKKKHKISSSSTLFFIPKTKLFLFFIWQALIVGKSQQLASVDFNLKTISRLTEK